MSDLMMRPEDYKGFQKLLIAALNLPKDATWYEIVVATEWTVSERNAFKKFIEETLGR